MTVPAAMEPVVLDVGSHQELLDEAWKLTDLGRAFVLGRLLTDAENDPALRARIGRAVRSAHAIDRTRKADWRR